MAEIVTTRHTLRADTLRLDVRDGIVRLVESERAGRQILVKGPDEGLQLAVEQRGSCLRLAVDRPVAVDVEVPRGTPVRIDGSGTAFVETGALTEVVEAFVAGSAIVQLAGARLVNAMVTEEGAIGVSAVSGTAALHLSGHARARIDDADGADLTLAARDDATLHVTGRPTRIALTAEDRSQVWLPPTAPTATVSRSGRAQIARARSPAELV